MSSRYALIYRGRWRESPPLRRRTWPVVFDARGHGNSAKPRGVYKESTLWVADLHAILESLSPTDQAPILVGWSYGGLMLADYLATYGDDAIAGINLVGAISEKGTPDAARFAGDEFAALGDSLGSTDAEESIAALDAFLELCVANASDLSAHDRYFMLGYNAVVPPYVRTDLQERTVEHNETLRQLTVPVLLTHGDADQVVLPAATKKHASLIPTAETSWYTDVGHSPFWEAPERFNRELAAFAERL